MRIWICCVAFGVVWKKELRISQTHNGRNLDLFLERERERERWETICKEEGEGGAWGKEGRSFKFWKKTQHRSLSLFSFQIHFAPLLRTVLCFLYFLKRETTKKKFILLLGYLGLIKPESNLKPNRINYSQNHPIWNK